MTVLLRVNADVVSDRYQWQLALLTTLLDWYLKLPAIEGRMRLMMEHWNASAPVTPQLYLYSEADGIVPANAIERFIATQVLPRSISVLFSGIFISFLIVLLIL